MEPWDIASLIASFVVTGWFLKIVLSKDRDKERVAEDDARAFFDRHGVWPDEVPPERRKAMQRRTRR